MFFRNAGEYQVFFRQEKEIDMKSLQIAAWFIVAALIIYVLIVAKQLIIPLVIAISIWFLINTIATYFDRIRIGRIRMPHFLSLLAATILIIAALAGSVDIILRTMDKMLAAAPAYEQTLDRFIQDVVANLPFEETPSLARLLDQIDIRKLVISVGGALSNFASKMVLIIIYIIFLLLEERFFPLKFRAFFPSEGRYRLGLRIRERISGSVRTYITVKTFVSLLTGGLSYLILRFLGIDFAEFWAFFIFLMNFIPSIGSLVATGLVSLFALLQFESGSMLFLTLIGIGTIQLVVGSYLDPRLLGRSLNISPLVVLLSLALWGSIWGIIGMVLSVPLMVMLMIILAQFPATAPLAVLLSQNGQILLGFGGDDPSAPAANAMEQASAPTGKQA